MKNEENKSFDKFNNSEIIEEINIIKEENFSLLNKDILQKNKKENDDLLFNFHDIEFLNKDNDDINLLNKENDEMNLLNDKEQTKNDYNDKEQTKKDYELNGIEKISEKNNIIEEYKGSSGIFNSIFNLTNTIIGLIL
jgi:hypothetical protein